MCGFVAISKMFPMIEKGCGPGGRLVDSGVWLNNLGMKMRMIAFTKVISRSIVW